MNSGLLICSDQRDQGWTLETNQDWDLLKLSFKTESENQNFLSLSFENKTGFVWVSISNKVKDLNYPSLNFETEFETMDLVKI